MFTKEGNRLIFSYDAEKLWIEPWGSNALRIRATKDTQMPEDNWALQMGVPPVAAAIEIGDEAVIVNGNVKAVVSKVGKITVYAVISGKKLLEEYLASWKDHGNPEHSALNLQARDFKPIIGGDFRLTARFKSLDPNEKIFGMGQYQHPFLDHKGLDLDLCHRNSQVTIPFAVSSLGYGFLWNNPAIGKATFGKHVTTFEAASTKILDYWIVAGDSPRSIVEAYASVVGYAPTMPEYGLGFWQCKLRYQTQEELLGIAREYRRREIPLDVIVADYFHWPLQGDWKFDPTYWPDPGKLYCDFKHARERSLILRIDAMIHELKEMKIELMVSIWPTVDKRSENYNTMLARGLLVQTEHGIRQTASGMGEVVLFDATNPEARQFIWQNAYQNYHAKGVRMFWLDEAEPSFSVWDYDNYRFHLGPMLKIGNLYPVCYARAFYEGMTNAGQTEVVNLIRCAWAGSQRYGALVWSGDIPPSWDAFRYQLTAGLNIGLAGIPWWTTDIGGFFGGNPDDEGYRELFIRWFQWATFCPVMRLHGFREPIQPQHGNSGGAACRSGAANEIWSYGEKAYEICKKHIQIREDIKSYTRRLMKEASENGVPVIRTLFFEFPDDETCWTLADQYMYGDTYLCAPVLHLGQRTRSVYLPRGSWASLDGSSTFQGGKEIEVDCPLEMMPVFVKQA